jgi:hypothetical protein
VKAPAAVQAKALVPATRTEAPLEAAAVQIQAAVVPAVVPAAEPAAPVVNQAEPQLLPLIPIPNRIHKTLMPGFVPGLICFTKTLGYNYA